MNAAIGAEAALFPEKEFINGIVVAVYEINKSLEFSQISILVWLQNLVLF
jgi:hypothetical protein